MSFAHFNSRRSKRTPAYFFLQINQSSLLKLLSMESGHPNYPRVKKIFLQKWNRKRKRVGKRICLIPKQLSIYLNPTLPPTIYLLLSESYGSALAKLILAFNYETQIAFGWQWQKVWRPEITGKRPEITGKGPILSECLVAVSLYKIDRRRLLCKWCQEKIIAMFSWGSAPCKVSKFILSKNLDQQAGKVGSKKVEKKIR